MDRNRHSLLDFANNNPSNNHVRTSQPVEVGTQVPQKDKISKKISGLKDGLLGRLWPANNITNQQFSGPVNNSLVRENIAPPRNVSAPPMPSQSVHPRYSAANSSDQPLLDLAIIARSVWQKKYMIILCGIIGLVAGVVIALSTPHKYHAMSEVFLDPREIKVTDTQIGNNQASSQVLLAIVDSQMRILKSTPVLDRVIDELDLTNDPEFSGEGGFSLSGLKNAISGSSGAADKRRNVLKLLRDGVTASRDPQTFVVSVGMISKNPETAANVANSVVKQYLKEFQIQQSDFFEKTTNSIQSRVDELRERLDDAEQAVVAYRSENDIIDVGGGVINEKEMLALSDELAKVRAEQVAMSISAEQLAKADVKGVLSGSFPEASLGNTLVELRKQYSSAKSSADSLSVALGPRHPKFIAAEAAVKAVEDEVSNELRRIVSSTQKKLSRAKQSEVELAAKLAVLKAKASSQSSENVELRELERKALSIRQIYESLTNKSRETTVQTDLNTTNIQVISTADVPLTPSSMSRKITVLIFGILGFMAGLGIAILTGIVESIMLNFNPSNQVFQSAGAQPAAAYDPREPNAPHPANQPFSQGAAFDGDGTHLSAPAVGINDPTENLRPQRPVSEQRTESAPYPTATPVQFPYQGPMAEPRNQPSLSGQPQHSEHTHMQPVATPPTSWPQYPTVQPHQPPYPYPHPPAPIQLQPSSYPTSQPASPATDFSNIHQHPAVQRELEAKIEAEKKAKQAEFERMRADVQKLRERLEQWADGPSQ